MQAYKKTICYAATKLEVRQSANNENIYESYNWLTGFFFQSDHCVLHNRIWRYKPYLALLSCWRAPTAKSQLRPSMSLLLKWEIDWNQHWVLVQALCLGYIATDNGRWSSEIRFNDAVIVFNNCCHIFIISLDILVHYFSWKTLVNI